MASECLENMTRIMQGQGRTRRTRRTRRTEQNACTLHPENGASVGTSASEEKAGGATFPRSERSIIAAGP